MTTTVAPQLSATPMRPPRLVLAAEHNHVKSQFCGDLIEIVREDPSCPDVAVLTDVTHTVAHYHLGFDEVYFVLDGALNVRLCDPATGKISNHVLSEHEACIIPRGVHHQITSATQHNRLCVLCIPHFDRNDETASTFV